MLKVRFPKPTKCICKMPVDSNNIANVLPPGANSNVLLIVRFKRKLSYHVHLYFAVSRKIIYQALMYLKQNNNFYHDTDIALDNIPRSLLSLTDNTNDQESDSSNL